MAPFQLMASSVAPLLCAAGPRASLNGRPDLRSHRIRVSTAEARVRMSRYRPSYRASCSLMYKDPGTFEYAEGAQRLHVKGGGFMKSASALRGCMLVLWSASSVAQQHPTCAGAQIGAWTLLSMETTDQETNDRHNLLGVHPSGSLSYGSDCRMSVILVKESRKAPTAPAATDSEAAELYRGLIAYAGSYTIKGHTITHHIEDSWNQAWTGTTQVSQFNVDGDSMFIRTGVSTNPLTGRQSSTVFIWARLE